MKCMLLFYPNAYCQIKFQKDCSPLTFKQISLISSDLTAYH